MKRCQILLLLLLCIFTDTMAQVLRKFSVVSFEEKPLDVTATDPRYKIEDGNGALFSIIKLVSQTPDDDLSAYHFDFGLCEDREKTVNGERWIYVQRNAMHVTITREGFQPVKSELNLTVQEGKVYEMVLLPKALPVYREILQFSIQPAGVKATVMYKKDIPGAQFELFGISGEDGSVAKSLELGTYIYEIYSDNYHKSEGRIELAQNKGTHLENVLLNPNFSNITLKTGEGVDIYINDEKRGAGTWSGILKAGEYTVECRKDKHKSYIENIKVEENLDRVIMLNSPEPIIGALVVVSQPLGAHIIIDGKDYGITPKTVDNLLMGSHELEISKQGYKSEKRTVDIRENEITEHDVTLNRSGTTMLTNVSPVVNEVKHKYQQKICGYIEAVGQAGFMMGAGANVGCYLHNFNVEGYAMFGLAKSRMRIITPSTESVHMLHAQKYGARLGYGVILGSRFRLTPQVGAGLLVVGGDDIRAYAVTGSGALRCEYIPVKHFGISLTPEYAFTMSKKPIFETLSGVSKRINGWANGFNVSLGLYFYF